MSIQKVIEKIEMKLRPTRFDVRFLALELRTRIRYQRDLEEYIQRQKQVNDNLSSRVQQLRRQLLKVQPDAESTLEAK